MLGQGLVVLLIVVVTFSEGWELPAKSTYENHPCKRDCLTSKSAMTCEYNFTLEHYMTLSRACYNCPHNISDCFRPHCIPADGGIRAIKVVNRMMPGPAIHVCQGDRILVNVYNEQHDMEGAAIHWHGVLQHGSPHMDGVPLITQCPISTHSVFQYKFQADNPGTHYWHAHAGMQRADGIFGSLVVRETTPTPMMKSYDLDLPEHTIIVHDWLDQYASSKFSLHHNGMGDNKPSSILINGRGSAFGHNMSQPNMMHETMFVMSGTNAEQTSTTTSASSMGAEMDHSMMPGTPGDTKTDMDKVYTPKSVFSVMQGKRYRFRFISNGILNCPLMVSLEGHNLTIIASDGYDMDPTHVDSFTIYAGERYDVVVRADQPVGNYWLYVVGLGDCAHGQKFETAVLRYHGAPIVLPKTQPTYETGLKVTRTANPTSITTNSVPVSRMTSQMVDLYKIQSTNVKQFFLAINFNRVGNYRYFDPNYYSLDMIEKFHAGMQGMHDNMHMYAPQMNHITFGLPMSPVLSQYREVPVESFCNETSVVKDCQLEFCECIHRIKVSLGDVVELVLVSEAIYGTGNHPMHLHGHAFFVLGMEQLGESTTKQDVMKLDVAGKLKRNLINPVRKDTVTVPDGGYAVIRFKADNPGFWLFHCHVDFHFALGLTLVVQVGELDEMPQPPGNFPRCGNWRYSSDTEMNSYANRCPTNVSQTRHLDTMCWCLSLLLSWCMFFSAIVNTRQI